MEEKKTYYYVNQKQKIPCQILSVYEDYGASVLNHQMATMDYVLTTYYVIQLENGQIFKVTRQFLEEE